MFGSLGDGDTDGENGSHTVKRREHGVRAARTVWCSCVEDNTTSQILSRTALVMNM